MGHYRLWGLSFVVASRFPWSQSSPIIPLGSVNTIPSTLLNVQCYLWLSLTFTNTPAHVLYFDSKPVYSMTCVCLPKMRILLIIIKLIVLMRCCICKHLKVLYEAVGQKNKKKNDKSSQTRNYKLCRVRCLRKASMNSYLS